MMDVIIFLHVQACCDGTDGLAKRLMYNICYWHLALPDLMLSLPVNSMWWLAAGVQCGNVTNHLLGFALRCALPNNRVHTNRYVGIYRQHCVYVCVGN